MSTIAENIAAIRARIDTAARTTGRTGADITLVAATKMNDAARVREAVAAGIDACGENRVQEMTEKLAQGAYTDSWFTGAVCGFNHARTTSREDQVDVLGGASVR